MQGEAPMLEGAQTQALAENDAALLAAAATGDRDALSALYDHHSHAVLGLAKRMVGPGAAEDLLHDVFLEAWHHAAEYSPMRGSVRSWLLVRARSRALDRLGKRGRDARMAEEVLAQGSLGDGAFHWAAHDSDIDARKVGQLASLLAPELTAVLEPAYFEGLSCSEIAERLALPVGTVKSRLARALSQLRTAVGFHEGGGNHG
jgi:RNA polymerase sigma-70 factor, ECF subfamily